MLENCIQILTQSIVDSMFKEYLKKYVEDLDTDVERANFFKLLSARDSWSNQILENLWTQFEKTELTQNALHSIRENAKKILQQKIDF